MAKINSVKGMPDILPEDIVAWQHLESTWRTLTASYGYTECRMPVLESTQLFSRTIGDSTDIVSKEMFSLDDRDGNSLSLRPEGTASCVRLGVENGLLFNQQQRLWYMGPMFRYEKPQAGRYRQFHQMGMEAFGFQGAGIEAEQIMAIHAFWQRLGIDSKLTLQINSLGDATARAKYRTVLTEYFKRHIELLDDACRERLARNPLRLLDSKDKNVMRLVDDAPKITNYLSRESLDDYNRLQELLTANGVDFVENPNLVRGLDYYNDIVYEWVTDDLGAQSAVCAGGRYDSLVECLGGKSTPAVGFAIGMERTLLLLQQVKQYKSNLDCYFIVAAEQMQLALRVADTLRRDLPDFKIWLNCDTSKMKSQFKRADKSGAHLAFILGSEEADNSSVTVRDLRSAESSQMQVAIDNLPSFIRNWQQKGTVCKI